jgi:type IV secretory pathway VirB2 component (pilin)
MRSSWRLDAKWVVGILFVLCAAAASITYSLQRVSAQEPATGTAASVIDALAEEMVDDEMFAELQAAAEANPKIEVQVNELLLPLTGKEIAGLTREETLEKAAARLADIIYVEGVEGAEVYFRNLEPKEGAGPSADQPPADSEGDGLPLEPLGLFTQETHDGLSPFVLVLSLGAAALLAVLVLLSRGFGRLGSPGLALVAGIGPAALTLMVLRTVFADARKDGEGMFAGAAEALYPTVDDLSRLFAIIVAVGAALIAAAIIAHIASLVWQRTHPQASESVEDEPPAGEPEEQPDYAADEGFVTSGGDELPSIGPSGVPQS